MRARIADFLRHVRGSSAAEFAIVLPVFLLLTLGTIQVGILMLTTSTLHSTVEAAARCASVRSASDCPDAASTEAFAASMYRGANVAPVFVAADDATCGKRVTATASYTINGVIFARAVPLSATACFPV